MICFGQHKNGLVRTSIRRKLLLAILSTLLAFSAIKTSHAQSYTFAVDSYLMSQNIEFLTQVRLLLAQRGHSTNLEVMSIPQALNAVESGQIDGHALLHPFHAQQRALIQIPTPVQQLQLWAWVSKPSACPKNTKAFRNKKPIVFKDAPHSDMAKASTSKGYAEASDVEHAIKLLQQQKGDYIFATWEQMSLANSSSEIELSVCGGRPILVAPVYMFIHPRNQALIPLLDQAAKNAQ